MSGTFTLVGRLLRHDKATPHVDSPIRIAAGLYPDQGDHIAYALGASVLTDVDGSFSVDLLTETDLVYTISSAAADELFAPIAFAAPANGTTIHFDELTDYAPTAVTSSVLAAASAAAAAALVSQLAAAASAASVAAIPTTTDTLIAAQVAASASATRGALQAYERTVRVAPSGDTTGATDTTRIAAALALLGAHVGVVRPTTDLLTVELGVGPYYINPNVLQVKASQRLVGTSPASSFIYCVGGTAGQIFIDSRDPSFSLSGVDLTSQGGEIANLTLDGSKAGPGTIGMKRGDLLSASMDIVVQKFGGNVLATTTATQSLTVNGTARSCGIVANSHIVTDATITLADLGKAVTGANIPAGAFVGGVVAGVSFTLTGASGPSLVTATATGSVTAQVGFLRSDATVGTTSGSSTLTDAAAVAGDLGSYIYGTGIPKRSLIVGVTPGVGYLIGQCSQALLYKNTNGWFERNADRVMAFDNAESITFDQLAPSAFNSDSYCDFWFDVRSKHGQRGVALRGLPVLYGARLRLTGGVSSVASGSNNGIYLLMTDASANNFSQLDIRVESGGASNTFTGHVPIHNVDGSSAITGNGTIAFVALGGSAPPWQVAKRVTGTLTAAATGFQFAGFLAGMAGASSPVTSYGMPVLRTAGLATPMAGFLSVSGSVIQVSHGSGNVFKAGNSLAAGTAYTLQLDATPNVGASAVLDYTLVLQQPGSGSPATIGTWPASTTFLGTAAPTTPITLDPTLGSRTVVHLLSTDGGSTWTAWKE